MIAGLRKRFSRPRSSQVALGIGDDCALLRIKPGWQVAVTTDLFLEGRHFRRDTHSAQSSGHRCISRGLSDLAAMGATPVAAFLSLALPRSLAPPRNSLWLRHFLDGFEACALAHRVPVAGGDTSESPDENLLADIVLVGQVEPGNALTRSGAKPGDTLWVSGSLGGSAAEFEQMLARATTGAKLLKTKGPQSFPEPRVALGRALAQRHGTVTACIDVSDGLSTDLMHLAQESGVAAQVETGLLPLHPLVAKLAPDHALALALHGGEDYELLFTTRPGTRLPPVLKGVTLTRIGRIVPRNSRESSITVFDPSGSSQTLKPAGWEHLR